MTDSADNDCEGRVVRFIAPVVLVLAVSIAYSNSFHGEFIFDDLMSIPDNTSIRQLWPLKGVLFSKDYGGRTVDARPIVNLSLAINYAVGGLDVRGYHVVNLLIHIAATLALYGVVRRTLLLPRWPPRISTRATSLAFVVALLWGLHPLQTESVTYLIQRAESMSGLFYLLTLYGAIRTYDSRYWGIWSTLSVLACALGMATKEVVATAPLLVMLYDRVLLFPSGREMLRRRRWLYVGLAASELVLFAMMVAGGGRGDTVGFAHGVTPLDYVKTQCWAIPHYLRLAIVPYPLVLDYGNEVITSPRDVLPGLAVMVGFVLGTVAGFRFQPWIGLLGTSLLLILAPSSSFVPVVTQTVAEHRMYLPLAAVVVFLVIAVDWAWDRLWQRAAWWSMAKVAAAGCAAIALGAVTWQRNFDYRTADTIWRDTMSKRPGNIRTHANMSDVFLAAGNQEAAIRELDICVQINPKSAAHRYNRGTLLLLLKRYDAALADFDEALKLDPSDAATWHNRGVAWKSLGRHDFAIRDFTTAIERDPQLAVAYESRAISYLALGQEKLAEADLRRFLALGGKLPEEPR